MEPIKLLYGSQNFGYNLPTSDKDWFQIHIPTYLDVVQNKLKISDTYNEDGSITKHLDIRQLPITINKANVQDIQILFSQAMFNIEPIKWFIDHKYELIHVNHKNFYYSNKAFITKYLNSYKVSNDIKEYIRALAAYNLILKVKQGGEFQFCEPIYSQYRMKHKIVVPVDTMLHDLELLEKDFQQDQDEVLFSIMEQEVAKVLKKYMQ